MNRNPLIDSRTAWIVACAALAASSIGFAAPLAVVVAMKPITSELDSVRAAVS